MEQGGVIVDDHVDDPPPPLPPPAAEQPGIDDGVAAIVPVPAPAAPAAEAGEREGRAPPGGWPTFVMPGPRGRLGDFSLQWSYDKKGHLNIRASCGNCGRTRTRTTWPGQGTSLRSMGQGRPLGMLWAWLEWGRGAGNCINVLRDHRDCDPGYAIRNVARRDALATLPAGSNFLKERNDSPPGVDGPQGEPYSLP